MNVLYVLVPVALVLAALGVLAFRWAVNNGQYDDLDSPAYRMLIDDESTKRAGNTAPSESELPKLN